MSRARTKERRATPGRKGHRKGAVEKTSDRFHLAVRDLTLHLAQLTETLSKPAISAV